MVYSPGEQQVLDAIRGLKGAMDEVWYHGLPIYRQDVYLDLMLAASRHLDAHPKDHQVRVWMETVYDGADKYLFNGGVASRFCGSLNRGRVITVSRNEYWAFVQTAEQSPNGRPYMSIPDRADRAQFIFIRPGEVNPNAETVPLFMVQEDQTPGSLARWGMTIQWTD